jgi:hypothetical protein
LPARRIVTPQCGGAKTGHARDVLLRAHPLLDGGVVRDAAFNPPLVFATAEAQRWTRLHCARRMAPAHSSISRATDGHDAADTRRRGHRLPPDCSL